MEPLPLNVNIYILNFSRIEDDLKDMGIQASVEDMTEDEKNFYYFKVGPWVKFVWIP